ncbi:hypothetical protein GCM10009000_053690 [Halobacterium noricense]|uniref:Uncharacterized protein n=1 Tax=Haladaptatus pallidirubidus TaxID=1008152 RepID=A0AAV3UMV1_9EURY
MDTAWRTAETVEVSSEIVCRIAFYKASNGRIRTSRETDPLKEHGFIYKHTPTPLFPVSSWAEGGWGRKVYEEPTTLSP